MIDSVKNPVRRLLRWSQQYTGTDNVYIARGGFWTTLQFVVGSLASIVTVIAFGNLLPRESYGIYKYLLSLAGTFGFLTLTGMNTAVVRAVARNQAGILPYAVRLQLKYNMLSTAAVAILAVYYALHGNLVFAASLFFLAVALPLSSAYNTYGAVLVGQKRFDLLSFASSLSAVTAAAAVIIGLLFTDSVVILLGIYAAATLIPNILGYWFVRARLPHAPIDGEARAELRQTGFHLTAVSVIGTLAQYLDKIILFQTAGPAALAVYGFATAGPDRIKGFTKNWIGITLPRLSEKNIKDVRHVFYRRVGQSLLIGGIIAVAYLILCPFLFRWLLPQYLDSIRYSQVYALGLLVTPASVYIGNIFQGQNMLRAVYYIGIGGQVVRITLFLALGLRWGIWGMTIAAVATMAIGLLYSIVIWEIESRRIV